MIIPEFQTKEALFAWLVENKSDLIAAKKAQIKHADAVTVTLESAEDVIRKAVNDNADGEDVITRRLVINTTNLMDSHNDVHIPGLWNKSLKENRRVMLLQEHKMEFAKIIAAPADVKPSTKRYQWKELGAKYEGETEALVFDASIKRKRNAFMFDAYKDGLVDNHSVGMQYIKLYLAINDKGYKEELSTWNKYIDQVANRDAAEAKGYFFAVTEAKVIEGSAVPMGSNWITPTLPKETDEEPAKATPTEPPEGTRNIINEIKQFKIY